MDKDTRPVIDWTLGIKLAGNKRDLAEELLALLRTTLERDMTLINTLYTEQKYPELLIQVHKLHGAVSYCGVPRIKTLLSQLETLLKKKDYSNLSELMSTLNQETQLFFTHYQPSMT